MVPEWGHDELQSDLAAARTGNGEIILQKLALGSYGDDGEMDVFSMKLSRTQPMPTCYEVKVSRADFMADIRAEKFRRYEPWCERGYFACPRGLVSKKEIPDGWGLLLRGPNGWYSVQAPRRRRLEPDQWREVLLGVIMGMMPSPWGEPTRQQKMRAYQRHGLSGIWGQQLGREVNEIIKRNRELEGKDGRL